jgi:L-ascorbate metabolism protein UlaG (beta-lactamase superfamily)
MLAQRGPALPMGHPAAPLTLPPPPPTPTQLCKGSVRALAKRYGPALRWYVPLGLARWFLARGISNVQELDWWQSAEHPGGRVRVTATPAQHLSMRSPWSRKVGASPQSFARWAPHPHSHTPGGCLTPTGINSSHGAASWVPHHHRPRP